MIQQASNFAGKMLCVCVGYFSLDVLHHMKVYFLPNSALYFGKYFQPTLSELNMHAAVDDAGWRIIPIAIAVLFQRVRLS